MKNKFMKSFFESYKSSLKSQIDIIDTLELEKTINELIRCEKSGSNVYIIGNGGSAATASHMENDLGVGLKRREILDLNILSLSNNVSVISALANDVGYENIFYWQIKDKIKKSDILIAISCSGSSPNILKAVKYAKDFGTTVVGLTGFDGGQLLNLSDINFHVDTEKGQYGIVESMHVILNHMLYTYFINKEK